MTLFFTKMNGAGNDFILLDNRQGFLSLDASSIAYLCDRHRGIGADGILLVEWADQEGLRMVYFNADGSRASFCGNGARCFARFALETEQQNVACGRLSFLTDCGKVEAWVDGERVKITMPSAKNLKIDLPISLNDRTLNGHIIDTGVPHVVLFGDYEKWPEAALQDLGSEIRWHNVFQPEGTNVNFVWKAGERTIKVRTYERGVEGETLACGSGVTASALISSVILGMDSPIEVFVRSGERLQVHFRRTEKGFEEVFLEGPAKKVFVGQIELP
ncbi:diaminopimelate epimerase [Methylacidiphilum kamchatkense]|nr:diaminopimelate epimerase [Methylacidiphilum kamchatkense]